MIEAGLQRLRQLRGERSQRAIIEQFLSSLPLPVLFIDPQGKPALATAEAYDLCAIWNYGPERARVLNPPLFRLPAEIARACRLLRDEWPERSGPREVHVAHQHHEGLNAPVILQIPDRHPWSLPSLVVTLSYEPPMDDIRSVPKTGKLGYWRILTPSERSVASLVVAGRRNQEVAQALGKSLRTVESQLNGIYRKLGVRSRTELSRLLS